MAVDQRMGWLIRVTQQAIVTSPTTFLRPARSLFARGWVEMACFEGFARHLRKGVWVFNQSLPDTVSSLRSFPVEQPPVPAFANQFHRDFLLFYLEQQLHAPLECVPEREQETIRCLQVFSHWTSQKQ